MSASNFPYEKTYVRVLAGLFLLLGGAGSIYCIGMDLDAGQVPGAFPPPLQVQVLCFLAALFAVLFFAQPRLGHVALIGLMAAALLTGWTSASPVVLLLELATLAVLLLPLLPPVTFARRVSALAKQGRLSTTVPDSAS